MNVTFTDERPEPVDGTALVSLAERALRHEGYPETTELAITAVSEESMAELNAAHLGMAGPTDVLSFPLDHHRPGIAPGPDPSGPPLLLGDLVLAPDYIGRQAAEHGVTVVDEMALMVVHGVLHLMGWDHADDVDAEAMEAREREILSTVGVRRR